MSPFEQKEPHAMEKLLFKCCFSTTVAPTLPGLSLLPAPGAGDALEAFHQIYVRRRGNTLASWKASQPGDRPSLSIRCFGFWDSVPGKMLVASRELPHAKSATVRKVVSEDVSNPKIENRDLDGAISCTARAQGTGNSS